MDSIVVKVPVAIKAKLTEKLKSQLLEDYTKTIDRMELEMSRINLDQQKAIEENSDQERQIRAFFGNEIRKRQGRRNEALQLRRVLEKLELGAEINRGTLEHQVELKIGDNLREVSGVEILIEDDKVIEIRG